MPKMRDDLTTTDAFAILCSEGGVDTTPFADSASRTTAGCVRLNSSGRRTDDGCGESPFDRETVRERKKKKNEFGP